MSKDIERTNNVAISPLSKGVSGGNHSLLTGKRGEVDAFRWISNLTWIQWINNLMEIWHTIRIFITGTGWKVRKIMFSPSIFTPLPLFPPPQFLSSLSLSLPISLSEWSIWRAIFDLGILGRNITFTPRYLFFILHKIGSCRPTDKIDLWNVLIYSRINLNLPWGKKTY